MYACSVADLDPSVYYNFGLLEIWELVPSLNSCKEQGSIQASSYRGSKQDHTEQSTLQQKAIHTLQCISKSSKTGWEQV